MSIKTWKDRMHDCHPYGEIEDFKQAEIDELRAEIERLNSGWYDKLLKATLERDADIEQWKVDFNEVLIERNAQRKVLEQALKVLRGCLEHPDADEAITAIQGVLK